MTAKGHHEDKGATTETSRTTDTPGPEKRKRKTKTAREREKRQRIKLHPDPNKPRPCNEDTLVLTTDPAYAHAMLYPRGGVPRHADKIQRKTRENKTAWPDTYGRWCIQMIHASGGRVRRKVCRDIRKRSGGTIDLDHKTADLPQKAIVGMICFQEPNDKEDKWNDGGEGNKWRSAWRVHWALRFRRPISSVDGISGFG